MPGPIGAGKNEYWRSCRDRAVRAEGGHRLTATAAPRGWMRADSSNEWLGSTGSRRRSPHRAAQPVYTRDEQRGPCYRSSFSQ
jgi:hypothetical protein